MHAELRFDTRTATYDQLKGDFTPILARYGNVEGALLPILHECQHRYGWISEPAMQVIAEFLRITRPQVYEVATYYHEFSVNPPADVHVIVCAGPACRVEGGPQIQAAIEEATGIAVGDTRRDYRYSISTSACMGICFHPPAAGFNQRAVGRVRPEQIPDLLREAEHEGRGHSAPGGSGSQG